MTIKLPHLKFEKIADLAEGRLGNDERVLAMTHIHQCQSCGQELERLQRAIQTMRTDASEDAPRYAVASSVNLFRARSQAAPSGLRRLIAALTFDSLQMSPAFGMRSGASAERQLIFEAGENQIHLQVARSGERWVVSGQVLGECTGGEVEMRGATQSQKVSIDERCEFTLPPMAGGEYAVVVRIDDVALEIPDLKLGA